LKFSIYYRGYNAWRMSQIEWDTTIVGLNKLLNDQGIAKLMELDHLYL
jgi:hypothetical protein